MTRSLNIALLTRRFEDVADRSCPERLDQVVKHWRDQLDRVLPDRPDLVVIPEMCDYRYGSLMEEYRAFAAERGERLLDWFSEQARQHRVWMTVPVLRTLDDGTSRNSVYLLDRGGEVCGIYDKTFPMIEEVEAGVVPGPMPTCLETEFGRVACAICFDLNFMELCRHYAAQAPDLVLFCSVYHGGLAQAMWAYTCQAHFAAAVSNLPGQILSPLGQTLATTTNYTAYVTARVNTDCRLVHLDGHYEKFAQLKRALGPGVTLHDPGLLGSILVTNNDADTGIDDLLDRFGIEPLRAYLDRARRTCAAHRGQAGVSAVAVS